MTTPKKDFIYQGRVYFGDTDAAGVVYHGRYVYFLEAARIEMLEEIGCSYKSLVDQGIGLSPVDIHLKYHAPLRFSDIYTVKTSLLTLSTASFVLVSEIKCGSRLCCSGTVKLACIDETAWKPRRLPDFLVTLINA